MLLKQAVLWYDTSHNKTHSRETATMNDFLKALPYVATSPLAFVAYLVIIISSAVISIKTKRLQSLLQNIKNIPPLQRKSLIEKEMQTVLPSNILAEDWIKSRIHQFVFYGFILFLVFIVILVSLVVFTFLSLHSSTNISPAPTVLSLITPVPTNATLDLPSDVILRKYIELGGELVLGKARSDSKPFPGTDGWFQEFAGGTIYWSPLTQSHLILGAIQERWRSPVEVHRLGFPTSDEISTIDGQGKFQEFEHGVIYWSQRTGPHIIVGAILNEWIKLGKEASWLGYPISDEEEADGEWKRLTRFQHGVIKWSAEICGMDRVL